MKVGTARSGFTLLEVMAALAIVAIALTVLLVERNVAVQRTSRTNDRRVAMQLAEEKLNELVLGLETGSAGDFEDPPNFRWSAEEKIELVDAEGRVEGYLRRIEVTVHFPVRETDGKVTLVTAVRDRD